ncbi:hypothetical protein SAMN05444716_105542 [Streptomyces harbinensis]|uniref:Uncharacterized protein n=3 Tax=Bacteria TaxID=2 RepID=A0A1I6UG20_9ACTN|nr:hypothetical protein SAMN05444716_105542 [Streptomyces harbinensis]
MDRLVMVTGMCRDADAGKLPAWAHWTCLDAPIPGTPAYLRTDCTCWCHDPAAESELVPVPERHLVHVPAHRRSAAEQGAQRAEAV